MTPAEQPQVSVAVLPDYAPGLRVEEEHSLTTMQTAYVVSFSSARRATVGDDVIVHAGNEFAKERAREVVSIAVRQIQDEAVRELGLNHWRDEVRREVASEERAERRRILRALRDAVRSAPSIEHAALLIQDELDGVE